MKLSIYAVLDRKAGVFVQPTFERHEAMARRAFADACANPKTFLSSNSEDYALYELATYDDVSGKFENHDQPKHLADALTEKLNAAKRVDNGVQNTLNS